MPNFSTRLRRVARVMPRSLAAWTWLPLVSLRAWMTSSRSTAGITLSLGSCRAQAKSCRARTAISDRCAFAGAVSQRHSGAHGGRFTGDLRRQIAQQDGIAFGHHERALDDVLQFAHVARPVVFLQSLEARRGDDGFGRLTAGSGRISSGSSSPAAGCPRGARAAAGCGYARR